MKNIRDALLEAPTGGARDALTAAGARDTVLRLALVGGQLLALLAVVRIFQLENRTVFYLLVGAALAWVVHALLPQRFRLPFFGLISLASVAAVLGFPAGPIVLLVGFALIGICHVPVPYWLRAVTLVAVGGALLFLRNAVGAGSALYVVAPVLGAMFMFRLVLYLQAVRRGDVPVGLSWATAYLFMVPNVCYPLFPVVDYDRFVTTHFDADRFRIYDRGLRFMLRGVVHLLVYRLVYYDLALDSLYLNNLGDVARYVIANFLLYVKVSGQFHLIVGLLCLYGFRLPETNHLYFLASSPSDFWRRINIYWKDFMTRLVYYPSYFKLRKHARVMAVGLATANVFLITWLLHAYQFYWLRGGRLLAKRDVAFWGAFGAITIVAAVWEMRPGRPRQRRTDRSWSLLRGLSTVATFLVIAVLWSLWNAATLSTWRFMWSQTRYSTPGTWMVLIGLAAAFVALAGFGWGAASLDAPHTTAEPLSTAGRNALGRAATLASLLLLGTSGAQALLPQRLKVAAEHLHAWGWSPAQIASDQVGYYEQLTTPATRLALPWRPRGTFPAESLYLTERNDFLLKDLIASHTIRFVGQSFTTNSWGMRDRERTLARPADTYRIAVLGPSDVMGWGVADGEVFTRLLEARLDSLAGEAGQHAEVLNFGVPAFSFAQEVFQMEWTVLRFSPNLVVLAMHPYDLAALQQALVKTLAKGYVIPDSALLRLASRAGALPDRGGDISNLRLVEEDIDRLMLRRAQAAAARAHASLVVLLMRTPDVNYAGNLATTRRALAATGVPSIDCADAWDHVVVADYRSSAEDAHPNARGHRVIANCVFDRLTQDRLDLPGWPLATAPAGAAAAD